MTARGGIYGDLHGDGKPVAVATQPDSIPAEWIQTAALAVYETARDLGKRDATAEWADAPERYRNAAIAYATAAITILRPLIEAETRERCAGMLDTIAAWLPKEALQELRSAILAPAHPATGG